MLQGCFHGYSLTVWINLPSAGIGQRLAIARAVIHLMAGCDAACGSCTKRAGLLTQNSQTNLYAVVAWLPRSLHSKCCLSPSIKEHVHNVSRIDSAGRVTGFSLRLFLRILHIDTSSKRFRRERISILRMANP